MEEKTMTDKSELLEQAKTQMENMADNMEQPKHLPSDFMKLLQQSHLELLAVNRGDYQVKNDVIYPGTPLTVVSMRNYLMMGYKPLEVTYDTPRNIYKLVKDDNQVLMSDSPQEMFLHYDAYKNAKGRVLTSGLGLGLFARMVAEKEEVSEVVVVEIEKDIIQLCNPRHDKIKIIHDDIWKFIKTTDEKFDFIYIDIHYRTGAMEYIHTVLPMQKIFEEKFPNIPVMFWGEEEMKS